MDLPQSDTLDLDLSGGWLTVWFNTPEERNPLTRARVAALLTLADALQGRRDMRGVVFRGRGGVFSAGGDLKAFSAMAGASRAEVMRMSEEGAALFDAINRLEQFTVMAVEGAAMAGGFGLLCCADLVIAERRAQFALSEVRLGLTPAQIAPFVLSRLGPRITRRLMLTGARISAQEAEAIGLADELVDGAGEMDAALARLPGRLAGVAPGALAATKTLIRTLPHLERSAQIRAAAGAFADALLSAEGQEGVAAFLEKRKPNWAEE